MKTHVKILVPLVLCICLGLGIGLLAPVASSAGPIVVGNGGGSSEFYVYYARSQAEAWLNLCAQVRSCASKAPNLIQLFRAKVPFGAEILLQPSRELGKIRFRTDPNVGAKIFVNQDFLWKQYPTEKEVEPFDLADVMSLLVEIWGFQVGTTQGDAISLGEGLADLIRSEQIRSPWSTLSQKNLSLVQFRLIPDLLLVEDRSTSDSAVSREIQIASLMTCESSSGSSGPPMITSAGQFRWNQVIGQGERQTVSVVAQIEYRCSERPNLSRKYSAQLILHLPIIESNGGYHVKTGPIRVTLQRIQTEI